MGVEEELVEKPSFRRASTKYSIFLQSFFCKNPFAATEIEAIAAWHK
jgi:hypothetical protein